MIAWTLFGFALYLSYFAACDIIQSRRERKRIKDRLERVKRG